MAPPAPPDALDVPVLAPAPVVAADCDAASELSSGDEEHPTMASRPTFRAANACARRGEACMSDPPPPGRRRRPIVRSGSYFFPAPPRAIAGQDDVRPLGHAARARHQIGRRAFLEGPLSWVTESPPFAKG